MFTLLDAQDHTRTPFHWPAAISWMHFLGPPTSWTPCRDPEISSHHQILIIPLMFPWNPLSTTVLGAFPDPLGQLFFRSLGPFSKFYFCLGAGGLWNTWFSSTHGSPTLQPPEQSCSWSQHPVTCAQVLGNLTSTHLPCHCLKARDGGVLLRVPSRPPFLPAHLEACP